MIRWLHQEEGACEGSFRSNFFRDDENGDELSVYVQSPNLTECAEKCVEAFNNLAQSEINEICKEIISCAKESGINEEFELPTLDNTLDILYCRPPEFTVTQPGKYLADGLQSGHTVNLIGVQYKLLLVYIIICKYVASVRRNSLCCGRRGRMGRGNWFCCKKQYNPKVVYALKT